MAEAKQRTTAGKRSVATRWTPNLAKAGWSPISDFFLDNYHRLNPPIKYAEAMLIIHLMRHKWDEAAPFPSFPSLAKKMGISPQAARLHARNLQANGYLTRQMRIGETNRFHLDSLFVALEKLMAKGTLDAVQKNYERTFARPGGPRRGPTQTATNR